MTQGLNVGNRGGPWKAPQSDAHASHADAGYHALFTGNPGMG